MEIKKNELGKDTYKLVSSLVPSVNIDLIIINKKKQILLTWRPASFKYNDGWHFPGGIIRLNETLSERCHKVAFSELGAKIKIKKKPAQIHQMILSQKYRSHFITFAYKAKLISGLDINKKFRRSKKEFGSWKWFDKCPKNLILPHLISYSHFFKKY
jgi:ADP-ribose pyrophosphatase YjhB (NUDIX family)